MGENNFIRNMIDKIIASPVKHLLIGLGIVFVVTIGMKNLTSNFSYRIWFDPDNPRLVEFDKFERQFGSDELAVAIVHSPSGIFDLDSAQVMNDITADFWKAPEVIRVDSLANFSWVHAFEDESN